MRTAGAYIIDGLAMAALAVGLPGYTGAAATPSTPTVPARAGPATAATAATGAAGKIATATTATMQGTCTTSRLGQPCPSGGAGAHGAPAPVLNLGAGNPVHLVTGNKYQREVDLPGSGGHAGLEIVRHYNALDPRAGPLGRGWTLSYDIRLHARAADGLVQIAQADGSRVDFRCDAACRPLGHAQGSLQRRSDAYGVGPEDAAATGRSRGRHPGENGNRVDDRSWHWRWHWIDGRTLHFDAAGWLVRIETEGHSARIAREANPGPTAGAITEVADDAGNALRFAYEIGAAGARLARIDTPFGSYTYHHDIPRTLNDERGAYRLTGVAHPAGWRRDYAYESVLQSGNPYLLTGITWRTADDAAPLRTHSWAYDALGRAVLSTRGSPASRHDRVEIAYLAMPAGDGTAGLTRVRGNAGTTDFHTAIRGGRPVLLRVDGAGCPGCAAPGLQADYDARGRLTRLNGLHMTRGNHGAMTGLRDTRSGWPGLSLSFANSASDISVVPASRDIIHANAGIRGPGTSTSSGSSSVSGSTESSEPVDPPNPLVASGRLAAWSSDATGTETQRRDEAGRVVERRYANGDIWRHAYDASGRPVETIMRSATGALRTTVAWQGAMPTRISHPHENEIRRHDSQGRLVAREVHRPALTAVDRAYRYRETYAWDEQGRLLRHDLPEGGRLTYAYDDAGRVARIAWENGTDIQELLRALPDGGYLHGNGLRTRGLLRHGNLDALAVDDPSASERPPILLQRLHYDPAGRIAGETLRVDGWHAAYGYGHDGEDRLAAATAALQGIKHIKGTEGIEGDTDVAPITEIAGIPEIAGMAPASRSWRYAWRQDGRTRAVQGGGATRTLRARHDASGLPLAHGGLRLRYGPDRRLASVSQGGKELARYAHNAFGERIRRHAGGRVEDYLYVSNRLVAIAGALPQGGVGVTQRFVYAGWVPVAMIAYPRPRALDRTGEPSRKSAFQAASTPTHRASAISRATSAARPVFHAVHADAIGMPHAMTDATGKVRWRALWSPTGATVAIDGDLALPLRQPGHIHDPATGLHDNYLRSYDPRAGHYLEPDPIGPMPGTQVYGYADQQPRRHIDPDGLLLFAFDGTNKDADARTNVALMSGWYADGTAFYHRGPGFAPPRMMDAATGGSSPAILETQWNALLREFAAAGHAGSVAIDLLGYSRGAALAMHFGNMIAQRHHNGRFWTRDPALGTVSACADLRFMGLFDVVAQFGVLGSRNTDYDLAVSAEWRWVAHAVALNERRRLFPLSLPPEGQSNMITAPFIGAHGDIGGGYLPRPADPESARPGGDLSDVALAWMLKQAEQAGAAFLPPPAAFRRVDHPVLHDERGGRARRNNEDRAVLEGGGDTLMNAQAEHPRYGDAARAEVEAFIHRVRDWTRGDEPAVATVDMQGYRDWLRRTLDMDTAP